MSRTSPVSNPPYFGPPKKEEPEKPDFGPPKPKSASLIAPSFGPPPSLGTTAPAEALSLDVQDDRLAARIDALEGTISPNDVAKALLNPPASALRSAADLLSRGMYAAAGTTEEVLKGTPQNIPSRVMKEVLSGVAGVRGQKKDFIQVARERGLPEGPRANIPTPLGTASFSARDVVGLAANLGADPLNAVGFGATGLVRKVPVLEAGKYVGEITLSKKGLAELGKVAKAERPQALRYAMRLAQGEKNTLSKRLSFKEALEEARSIEIAADEVAYEAAAARIAERVKAGQGKGLVDEGGFKVLGKTVWAPKASSVTELVNATSPGRAINQMARPVINELDRTFNETDKFARAIPGYENIKVQWRDYRHKHLVGPGGLKETVRVLTKGLSDEASNALVRHIDNPAKYPIDVVPESWRHLVPKAKSLFAEWFDKEARRGLIPDESFRQNYVPHMFDNTPEQLAELSTHYTNRGGRNLGQFSVGPHKEARSFDTLDEIEEFAKVLKAEGIIKWNLKPVTRLSELMSRRGMSHVNAMAADQFFTTIKARLGVPESMVEEATQPIFQRFGRVPEGSQEIFTTPMGTKSPYETHGEQILYRAKPKSRILSVDRTESVPTSTGGARFQGTGEAAFRKLKGEKAWEALRDSVEPDALDKMGFDLARQSGYDAIEGIDRVSTGHAEYIGLHPEALTEIKPGSNLVPLVNDQKVAEYGLAKAWGYGGEPLVRRDSGKFEGWWLPRQIHRDLDGMEKRLLDTKDVSTLLKGFDFIQDSFKLGNTVIFPAYHTRNTYSNVAANYVSIGLSALNPKKYIKAAAVMTGKDGTLLTPLRRYTFDEVRQLAWEQGIFKDFAQIAELRSGARKTLDQIPLVNVLSKGGSAIENDSRLMLFMKHLEDGAPPEQAAKMVKRFLFDYEAISPIERQVISRIIPFWIWRKKNLALTVQEMARTPGRYAAQAKMFYNPAESGPDPNSLPDYLRGSLKIKIQREPKARFITGIDLPVNSALDIVFNDSVERTLAGNVSSIHPVLKSIVELSSGRDLFTGRDLYEPVRLGGLGQAIAKMPKPVQEWMEFRKEEGPDGKPTYYASGVKTYLLFRGWAQARMLSTYDRVLRYDSSLKAAMLDIVVGLRTKETDLLEDQERVIRARVGRLEKELYRKGKMKKIELYRPIEDE